MMWGWVTLGSLMLATGCQTDPSKGWVIGTTYNTNIKTIAIPVVQNDTFDREVGYLLTNALIREVETRTPWRVTGETVADTLLDVTITDVKLKALSQSRLTSLD
ncbi:MAG: LPS assembly lipoprotein LptE, partial [Phycisphaerales bacterium]|nr:LPS assembly lipoprotein LptE [Phycisphaerales bacterium]